LNGVVPFSFFFQEGPAGTLFTLSFRADSIEVGLFRIISPSFFCRKSCDAPAAHAGAPGYVYSMFVRPTKHFFGFFPFKPLHHSLPPPQGLDSLTALCPPSTRLKPPGVFFLMEFGTRRYPPFFPRSASLPLPLAEGIPLQCFQGVYFRPQSEDVGCLESFRSFFRSTFLKIPSPLPPCFSFPPNF